MADNGNVITDQKEILNELRKYYQNLFKSKDAGLLDCSTHDLQNLSGFKMLSENDANSLEGRLTINEISKALKAMKNQKCPGIDSFSADFFKIFWAKLKFFVLRSLDCGYNTGQISISLRQYINLCLPKGDKPRQFLKKLETNFTPISSIYDCFICSGCLVANCST